MLEITEEMAESLVSANEGRRPPYEYDSERLYGSAPVHAARHSGSADDALIPTPVSAHEDEREWVPIDEYGEKVSVVLLATFTNYEFIFRVCVF